ncbi:MAG TPA: hypothetical protein VNM39_16580 [Verrucomicrobiae bacterium]|nr:hypothetical protein [Verrucomicrobiae bacterium]
MQGAGKVVVGANGVSGHPFAAVRFLSNGRLDHSFGSDGVASATFAGSSPDARSVAVQANGRIVVAGSVNNGSFDMAVARFLP